MTVRAVLFDVGNTLLTLDYPRLARGVAGVAGVPVSVDGLVAAAPTAARALEGGGADDRDRAVVYLETLLRLVGVPPGAMGAVRSRLAELHRERHLWTGVASGTAEALDRLRRSGRRLGVVSNGDGRVDGALAAAGLRRFFEVVVDSRQVGVEKPDPRIFHAALERLGVRPPEALYVGDVYEVDVLGARAAGMDAVLLDPAGREPGRDVPVVRSLTELADALVGRSRD
ncbi:MAG TPA: HAD family hydrolase [Gemmatimonadales bacterium]|nr:HAD family hydrolase [Gemmatimonadales bacterium]